MPICSFFYCCQKSFFIPIRHVSKTNKFTYLYCSSVLSLFINCQLGNIFKNLNGFTSMEYLMIVLVTWRINIWLFTALCCLDGINCILKKKNSRTQNTDHNHSVRLEENWYTDSVLLLLANKYPQTPPQPIRHVPNTTKFTFVYFLFRFL